MNAIGASILIFLILVVLFAPRRAAMLGMMAGVLYLTYAQQVFVFGFNMFAIRFLELAGFIRVMSRGEFSFSRLNSTDRSLLLLYTYTATVYALRATEGGKVYVIGMAVDASLVYFTFRGLIGDMEDFAWLLRAFVVLLAPYALLVMHETLTGHNAFAFIGGGDLLWERAGRFRSVGTFRHPDLLGSLGASFLPLYIGLAHRRAARSAALMGIGLCGVIVWCSNAGGPLCAAANGLVGWALWFARKEIANVRRGLAVGIILLALVMKAPVWYLLARMSEYTGGDGWHRAFLMDMTSQHLSEWWLVGIPLADTKDWFTYYLSRTGAADITNTFILFALTAGLGALALLILLLKRAFSGLGKALVSVRSVLDEPSDTEFLLWGLGVTLAVHVVNWLGITYFDQFYVIWFMQLAAISGLSESCAKVAATVEPYAAEDWDILNPEVQYNSERS
jgi:hypothetical protein